MCLREFVTPYQTPDTQNTAWHENVSGLHFTLGFPTLHSKVKHDTFLQKTHWGKTQFLFIKLNFGCIFGTKIQFLIKIAPSIVV